MPADAVTLPEGYAVSGEGYRVLAQTGAKGDGAGAHANPKSPHRRPKADWEIPGRCHFLRKTQMQPAARLDLGASRSKNGSRLASPSRLELPRCWGRAFLAAEMLNSHRQVAGRT